MARSCSSLPILVSADLTQGMAALRVQLVKYMLHLFR
jgi:hypothetical protein